MRSTLLATAVSSAIAAVVTFVAPAARADGFYVTLSGGVTMARTWGAMFDATSQAQTTYAGSTGVHTITPVHVEVDDWTAVPQIIATANQDKTFTAVVEFTKTTNGAEQVTLIATYSNCKFRKFSGTFSLFTPATATTPAAGPGVTQTFEFLFDTVGYTAPAAPTTGIATVTKGITLPSAGLPSLSRSLVTKMAPPPQVVTTATLSALTNPGVRGEPITRLTFGFTRPFDPHTGQAMGQEKADPVESMKNIDGTTPALQAALTAHTQLKPVTFDFFSQSNVKLYTVTTNATVSYDQIEVSNGVQGEHTKYTGLSVAGVWPSSFVNVTTNMTGAF